MALTIQTQPAKNPNIIGNIGGFTDSPPSFAFSISILYVDALALALAALHKEHILIIYLCSYYSNWNYKDPNETLKTRLRLI